MRRLLLAVLVGTVVLALAGCGGEEDETVTQPTAAEPAASAPAGTTVRDTTAAAPPESTPSVESTGPIETEPPGASITVPPASTEAGPTSLDISVWELGKEDGAAKEYTLTCFPTGGTLPEPERACAVLAAGAATFEPTPADAACTMIYGGPAYATVKGTVFGAPVDASFTRANGCEIDRWDTATALLPADLRKWAGDEGLLGSSTSG